MPRRGPRGAVSWAAELSTQHIQPPALLLKEKTPGLTGQEQTRSCLMVAMHVLLHCIASKRRSHTQHDLAVVAAQRCGPFAVLGDAPRFCPHPCSAAELSSHCCWRCEVLAELQGNPFRNGSAAFLGLDVFTNLVRKITNPSPASTEVCIGAD